MRSMLHIFIILMTSSFLLLIANDEASAESINVSVRAIAASTQGDSFDESLGDLRNQLNRAFAGYSNFEQVAHHNFTIRRRQSNETQLPNGSTMTLSYNGKSRDRQFIKLGLDIAGRISTTLRATPGSTFFQAGLDYRGGILILAIRVE